MLKVEDWAEIRRLHRAEGVPIKEIARRLGVARNTVRAALASDRPPRYERARRGSVADAYELQVRALLVSWPRMPGPVVAQRIGWPYSEGPLKKLLARIRPEYVGIDPVDRVTYEPGQLAQCDLWFPAPTIPVAAGQARILPVLVIVLGFSRFLSATMIPSRQAGDILSGMWQLISGIGRVPKTLVWDRESAIGGTGRVSVPAAAFAGTVATRIRLAPPRDPEFKGMVERNNGFFETSFLPGRVFASPADFNDQLADWLVRANTRTVRAIGGCPVDLLETDRQAMTPLPPVGPQVGLTHRIRLARDYYVRIDANDYSIDPRVIGRFVDVVASPTTVEAFCDREPVARHDRSWAKHGVITDPAHVATAHQMRLALADQRRAEQRAQQGGTRRHGDGHPVALRALPDYDALFGVDFDPITSTAAEAAEASNP
ncbi:MAG: IS21 family transposase [Pseudonocardia sp.]|uniref:IS21 family transposase n=1 Tax=Pseudonocardia sp. TaxID=60912 RepID=UPI001AC5B30C|nr:IS21 family transposase [Pseudonocardia sp.]MBN9096800.1 IS21 family transposase [Pseudonocardia sp.]